MEGHTDSIRCMAYATEEQPLFTASTDKTIRRWRADSGEQVCVVRLHASPVVETTIAGDALLSTSSKMTAFSLPSRCRHGVLVQTTFGKDSTKSCVKAYMEPFALHVLEVYSRPTTMAQLLSFACGSAIPLPPSLQSPAAHLRKFHDFGLDLELGGKTVFLIAFPTIAVFFISIVTQEAVEFRAWQEPASVWVHIFTAMAVFCRVCADPLFMPLTKIMLLRVARPLATPFTVGWCATVVAASVAVLSFLTFLSFRLARVDFALKALEVKRNICDTGGDILTKERHQRTHPLSSTDPKYNVWVVGVKLVLLLNTIIMTQRALVSILCGIQVVAGIVSLYAGITYEQYVPQLPGSFNMNHLQTGLDAGVVSSCMVALIFSVKAIDKQKVDAAWCNVLLAMLLCCGMMALVFLRGMKTLRCGSVAEHQGVGEESLLMDIERQH